MVPSGVTVTNDIPQIFKVKSGVPDPMLSQSEVYLFSSV